MQLWVNKLAKKAKMSVESGVKYAKKGSAKDFGAITHKLKDIFGFGIVHCGLEINPVINVSIPPKPKAGQKKSWYYMMKT